MGHSWGMTARWFFISISAFLGAISYIYPLWCAQYILIFLIPLFYVTLLQPSISFKEGFCWGLIFYTIFFYDLFRLIISHGFGIGRVVAIGFLLLYSCLSSSFWFWIAQKVSSLIRYCPLFITLCWVITAWFYFFWIDSSFFWIFGNWEGNQLSHFIIPLAIRPSWLYLLPILGKNLFLFIIIFFGGCCSLLFYYYNRRFFIIFILIYLLFFIMGWRSVPYNAQKWIYQIGCIIPQGNEVDPIDVFEQNMLLIDHFEKNFPQCTCIIMPESTLKFPLNNYQRYIQLWNTYSNTTIIVGGHRQEGRHLFNTLYQIKNGLIIDYYDKCHTLFFTERIPYIWSFSTWCKNLFLKNCIAFDDGTDQKIIQLMPGVGVTPLICSELFFTQGFLPENRVFLCIVNDSWFSSSYIPRLMNLHAVSIAILKKSFIIYVGYHYQGIIDPRGNQVVLPTLTRNS